MEQALVRLTGPRQRLQSNYGVSGVSVHSKCQLDSSGAELAQIVEGGSEFRELY
jgi:hypothetical protein